MAYTNSDNKIGVPDIATVASSGALGAPWVGTTNVLPSVSVEIKLGSRVTAQDATLGEAVFILLAVPVNTTVTVGLMYQWDKNYNVVVIPAGATSKNTGAPVAVAYTGVTSSSTTVQYAWFLLAGQTAVLKTAVTVSPQSAIYMSATAGRFYVTSSAGKQILGARTQNTATVTSTTSTVNVYFNYSSLEGA
jgi:hypothetical protein